MGKNILVTGGAGFVGYHLCKRLLSKGHKVKCLDNLYTSRIDNIIELRKDKLFEFINHDIYNPIGMQVDQIYNLACPASPVHYQKNPTYTTKTSVLGAINILDLATNSGARVLQASTSEVYGDPNCTPQPEKYWGNVNPIGIRSCYDEGKRCAESLFFDYHRQYGTDIRVIRIFNTYGPNMQPNDGRVISNFIVQALINKDITIYGDGSQTRSFQYVSDLVDGMIKTMDGKCIGPINIGNPVEHTITELARMVLALIPESKSKIVYMPRVADDPKQRKPDISLAKEMLDWHPKVNIKDGLTKTIQYFKNVVNTWM